MSKRLVTAEEAQAILDACDAPVPMTGPVVTLDDAPPSPLDAVPDLAATVVYLHAEVSLLRAQRSDLATANAGLTLKTIEALVERNELRAILAGREAPPTDAEIEAHDAAQGVWLCRLTDARGVERLVLDARQARFHARPDVGARWQVVRWWALDRDGCPCAWPVVPAEGSAP